MDLKRIASKAKELVDRRGGVGSLKEDATELKDIATGPGNVTDKAKAAAEAVKDPGAAGPRKVGEAVQETAPKPPRERAEKPRAGGGGRGRRQGRRASGGGRAV